MAGLMKTLLCIALAGVVLQDSFGNVIDTKPSRPTRTPRPPKTTTTVRPPPDVIQREGCGGVLEGNTGLVAYKYAETVDPNQVCVWTVRAPGAGEIQLSLDGDGFGLDADGTYVSLITVEERARLQKSHKILGGDRSTYTTEGQVVYILFRSGPSGAGSGFQLYFRGSAGSEDTSYWTGGNKTHAHFHLNRAQGVVEEFAYPDPRNRYAPNEFGSWVVNPEFPKTRNTLYLHYLDFEDWSCADYINIHRIDGDSPVFIESRCNTNTFFSSSFKFDTVNEPFVITFHSNYHSERSGFILRYGNDRYGNLEA